MYICVTCIRKYECMHCIILYFVATCKRPFGPLLLNKMKATTGSYPDKKTGAGVDETDSAVTRRADSGIDRSLCCCSW